MKVRWSSPVRPAASANKIYRRSAERLATQLLSFPSFIATFLLSVHENRYTGNVKKFYDFLTKDELVRCITVCICMLLSIVSPFVSAQIKLGAAQLPTLIDDRDKSARINDIMTEAFLRMDTDIELEVMRKAFLGSGLLSGKIDGLYAFLDLDDEKPQHLYSDVYLPLYLHAISKKEDINSVAALDHLKDRRVAIDNRFANTDQVRLIKGVKWGRNPSTFDAFKQLADDRSYYLMTSRLLVDEFNRLLRYENEQLVHFSKNPLIIGGFRLAMTDSDDNQRLIQKFNKTIETMQADGTYNQLLNIAWLTKDINGDGTADYISSRAVAHPKLMQGALTLAYPLDSTEVAEASLFYIDGEQAADWPGALELLEGVEPALRRSLLDEEVYQRIMARW